MVKISLSLLASLFIFGCSQNEDLLQKNQLFIPKLIDASKEDIVDLVLQEGEHQFFSGVYIKTMGINSSYLGPTVRLYKGNVTTIKFTNQLDEDTTIHGHGLHLDGSIDGGPHQIIKANSSWQIDIPVNQQASMSWYHPHLMGKTAEQVYYGLAGVYLIEDEYSKALDLPKTYGLNDIPIIIQDRAFSDGEMKKYKPDTDDMFDGILGDTLVVNGTVNAYHKVPKGWVRLRLLNASNARFYKLFFDKKIPFYKIATEGGF